MANQNIGHCECPICGLEAAVRETKKTKAYIHCDDCGFQGFARGHTADKLLRGKIKKVEVKQAPASKPAEDKKPVEIVEKQPAPAPVKAEAPAAVAVEQPAAAGAELTIFDKGFWGK